MKRTNVPELEDFDWFPAPLRDALTDILQMAASTFRVFDGVAAVIRDMLAASGEERIVDLCSGGGGPLLSVLDELDSQHGLRVPVVLTDKFPNERAFARAEAARPGQVQGTRVSTDATAVPEELTGVRTMFNALHHFPPKVARSIFAHAARSRRPIASFEIVERSPHAALMLLGLPPVVLGITPFMKPRSIGRLAMTYALPLLPAITCWDGFASCLRAYSPRELKELVDGLGDDGYRFHIERRKVRWLPISVTSVVGMPVRS